MKEDMLITMVMETKERVEKLEENGFRPADRELLGTIVTTLDFLVNSYKRLEDEVTLIACNVRTLNDDMIIVKGSLSKLDGRLSVVELKMASLF